MKNKGFTLIEVVVALGILTIALTSSITLIVTAMNLAVNTRDVTEGTALMQTGLADGATASEACCGASLPTSLAGYDGSGTAAAPFTKTVAGKTLAITLETTAFSYGSSPTTIDNSRFVKVTSKVIWASHSPAYAPLSTTQYVLKGK